MTEAGSGACGDPQPPLGPGGESPLWRRLLTIDAACAALVSAITLFVFTGVIFRYVLQMPLTWGEEFTRYAFTWLAFLSAALAMKYHGHSAIELLVAQLPDRFRPAQRILVEAIVAAFLILFVYYSYRMAMIAHGQRSSALRLPMSWVYAAAPVSSALMLLYALRNIWATWRGRAAP
jgi:TRAP-type transport system small permease protein